MRKVSRYGFLVGAQVDDAVGDHHVGDAVEKLHIVQVGENELGCLRHVCLGDRLLRPLDHVRSEIHAYRFAVRADFVGGKDNVDAGPTPEVHNCLARTKSGKSGRVAAATGEREGGFGD